MITSKHLLIFGFLFISTSGFAEVTINVVHPQQDSVVVATDSTFIFGSVTPVNADFYINDKRIQLYPNGAFIAMLPIERGQFSFLCEAFADSDTTILIRDVWIPPEPATLPQFPLAIDSSFIFPAKDWELYEDDVFRVAVKGSPGCKASFTIDGLVWDVPMIELRNGADFDWKKGSLIQDSDNQIGGIYVGTLYLQPWHRCDRKEIKFRLIDQNQDTIYVYAPGHLSICNSSILQFCQFTQDYILPAPGQRCGAQYFFPAGSRVQVIKRHGNRMEVRLTKTLSVWIRDYSVELLPPGIIYQTGVLTEIRTDEQERLSRLSIQLGERIPYRIEQQKKPATLYVTFYNLVTDSIRIYIDYTQSIIQNIHTRVISLEQVDMQIPLNMDQQWGYDSYFLDGKFILDIKKPPEIAGWPSSPLKNLAICLDPGHGPDDGAIGPTGLRERDITVKFCELLKHELEDKDAIVLMTREADEGVALYTRPALATLFNADILLSLHFNALPDGANPFKNRGIGNYYFHPMSEQLAYTLQERLWRKTKLKDFGVFREDLVLTRPTNMIAVLTEPAFIMNPAEEMLIQSEDYQKKVVAAIVDALEIFVKKSRDDH